MRWELAARLFEGSETELLGDYSTQDPRRWAVRYDELFPAIDAKFENTSVSIPRAYDAVLTRGFGDYMTLPPEGERQNHQAFHVDFGCHEF